MKSVHSASNKASIMHASAPRSARQAAVQHAVPVAGFVRARCSKSRIVSSAASSRSKRVSLRSLPVQARHDRDRAADVLQSLRSSCNKFVNRYDPVAVGTGVLLVTSYMVVVHHQAVDEALNISAFATTLGMVLQRFLR